MGSWSVFLQNWIVNFRPVLQGHEWDNLSAFFSQRLSAVGESDLSSVNIDVKASLTHKNIQVNWLNRMEDMGSGPFFYKTEL